MQTTLATGIHLPAGRTNTNCVLRIMFSVCFLSSGLAVPAQNNASKKDHKPAILSIAYFIESANNSVNSINSLLKKDNYRNKITKLNNPTNNDLGFNLRTEILAALKPLLDKAKKTDGKKFREVIESLLSNPEETGLSSVQKYLPAAGVFSTVLSMVGNLVVVEKKVTKADLDQFTQTIEQYFSQYERLNSINEKFSEQVRRLIEKSEEIKQDLHDFLVESICMMNKKLMKNELKTKSLELLIQKYYDPQNLQHWLDTAKLKLDSSPYPPDAPTIVKLVTSSIKRLQKDFESVYDDNYNELKELISSLKITIPNLDEQQLDKTNDEIDQLYHDSRQADLVNLNINQVDERMNTVCRIINTNR